MRPRAGCDGHVEALREISALGGRERERDADRRCQISPLRQRPANERFRLVHEILVGQALRPGRANGVERGRWKRRTRHTNEGPRAGRHHIRQPHAGGGRHPLRGHSGFQIAGAVEQAQQAFTVALPPPRIEAIAGPQPDRPAQPRHRHDGLAAEGDGSHPCRARRAAGFPGPSIRRGPDRHVMSDFVRSRRVVVGDEPEVDTGSRPVVDHPCLRVAAAQALRQGDLDLLAEPLFEGQARSGIRLHRQRRGQSSQRFADATQPNRVHSDESTRGPEDVARDIGGHLVSDDVPFGACYLIEAAPDQHQGGEIGLSQLRAAGRPQFQLQSIGGRAAQHQLDVFAGGARVRVDVEHRLEAGRGREVDRSTIDPVASAAEEQLAALAQLGAAGERRGAGRAEHAHITAHLEPRQVGDDHDVRRGDHTDIQRKPLAHGRRSRHARGPVARTHGGEQPRHHRQRLAIGAARDRDGA